MKQLLFASALLALAGCNSAPAENAPEANAPTPPTAQAPAPSAGGVAPMASEAAGGMTPMAGTDSVQGSGGGSTSMAAKGWAKDKINQTQGGSMGQAPSDE